METKSSWGGYRGDGGSSAGGEEAAFNRAVALPPGRTRLPGSRPSGLASVSGCWHFSLWVSFSSSLTPTRCWASNHPAAGRFRGTSPRHTPRPSNQPRPVM